MRRFRIGVLLPHRARALLFYAMAVEYGCFGPDDSFLAIAPLAHGAPGVLHGSLSYVLQDEFGQTAPVHSCSAGLDYPGVGPEHSWWKDSGRLTYTSVTDDQALDAFCLLAELEGMVPALESAHAVADGMRLAAEMDSDQTLVVNLSGRGDKDIDFVIGGG